MAAEGNIRFAVFARLSDGLALATFKGRGATASAVETTNKVLKSGNLKPKAQLTVTIDQTIGTLHLAAGDVDVIAVITSPDYPRRSAFQLLEEIRAKVDSLLPDPSNPCTLTSFRPHTLTPLHAYTLTRLHPHTIHPVPYTLDLHPIP